MKNYLIHIVLFMIGAMFLYTTIQHYLILWLSIAITMTVVTIIGAWKERRDKKGGGIFDWWDLACDELGGTVGIFLSIILLN